MPYRSTVMALMGSNSGPRGGLDSLKGNALGLEQADQHENHEK